MPTVRPKIGDQKQRDTAAKLAEACRLVVQHYGHLDDLVNPCVAAARAALAEYDAGQRGGKVPVVT
jgi:hypothetical protein